MKDVEWMTEVIKVQIEQGVAIVKIDNPPMNVLSNQVLEELSIVFTELQQNNDVVTVILTGEGEVAFMGGADIKAFPSRIKGEDEETEQAVTAMAVFNLIEKLPKPTIAVLNGYTLGGGLELALTCDFRIAEEHAKIGLPEIKLGLIPGAGGTQRLPRIVGESKAKLIMFTGKSLSAEEAKELGIVEDIAAKGEGINSALQLANQFGKYSLQSLKRIKQAVNIGRELTLEEALHLEEQLFSEVMQTKDAKEGIQAFIEKRKAQFTHQ